MKKKIQDGSDEVVIPRGQPKSGRVWKTHRTERHSNYKDKVLKTTWKTKTEERDAKKALKQYENSLKADNSARRKELRQRQEETRKKRLENERKGEIIQVIRNQSKIKKMKKKQLRRIEKR